MKTAVHSKLVSFIWSIADDCLRDVYVRGKYRDVILPMVVLRRLDALLEPTKDKVMKELAFQHDEAEFTEYIKDGKDIIEPIFIVFLKDYWGDEIKADATPRSSDGQFLFLMEMAGKMKPLTQNPQGSRIASANNGPSLFTGDAGGGENHIRSYVIENGMLEAIVPLPNHLFYNMGIAIYIWILSNHKDILGGTV